MLSTFCNLKKNNKRTSFVLHGFLTKQKSKSWNPYFCLLNCVQHHPREYQQSTLYYLGLYFAVLRYLLSLALFLMFLSCFYTPVWFCHLPWVVNLCCWLDVWMEAVGCLHRTLVRQKLLKQSLGVHEWGTWKVKVNILTHAMSLSSSIINNGNRFFSSAAEGVFALLETQAKGKPLLGNRNQCKDSCRDVQPLLYVRKKLTVECFAIAVWFFVSCTWSALI